ncbi:MAG: GNAT family N-acetyltransferase [Acidimicrobiales bacterium]
MSERLYIAPVVAEDAAEMVAVLADPMLYEYTGGSAPDVSELNARYERQLRDSPVAGERWFNWIVRLTSTDEAIGFTQATVVNGSADIAWLIGVSWQGQGLGTAATKQMMDLLIGLGVQRFRACIHADHLASQHVAASSGLSPTSELADGEMVWILDP